MTLTVSLEICWCSADISQILILLLHQFQCNILFDSHIHIIGQWQWQRMLCENGRCYREFLLIIDAVQVQRIVRMRIVWIVAQLIHFHIGQHIHHIRFVCLSERFKLQEQDIRLLFNEIPYAIPITLILPSTLWTICLVNVLFTFSSSDSHSHAKKNFGYVQDVWHLRESQFQLIRSYSTCGRNWSVSLHSIVRHSLMN